MKLKTTVIALLICSNIFGQEKEALKLNLIDFSISAGSQQFNFSGSFVNYWQMGIGGKLTSSFATDKWN